MIEAKNIRLDKDNGKSMLHWVEKLRESGEIIAFKSSMGAVPNGLALAKDAFVLVIQTKYQKEVYQKWGNEFIGVDATHNTTHYDKMSLFTIMVRDQWGHVESINFIPIYEAVVLTTLFPKRCPAMWMLSSNATEATVDFFMGAVQTWSPKVNPKIIMSDCDWAQINPAQRRWPLALVLLCWWHVLHVWHQHLQIYEHPVLWGLLKGWIWITKEDEFNECWAKIHSVYSGLLMETLGHVVCQFTPRSHCLHDGRYQHVSQGVCIQFCNR